MPHDINNFITTFPPHIDAELQRSMMIGERDKNYELFAELWDRYLPLSICYCDCCCYW